MKTVPDTWTEHHSHRLFHSSMLVVFAYIMLVVLAGLFLTFLVARGTDITYTDSEGFSLSVPVINAGPSQVVATSGGDAPPLPTATPGTTPTPSGTPTPGATPTPTPTLESPTPTPESFPTITDVKDQQTHNGVLPDGTAPIVVITSTDTGRVESGGRYVFTDQFPQFSGSTNMPYARVTIEIHSFVERGSTTADAQGNWSWTSYDPIAPGNHTVIVTSADPNDSRIMASSTYKMAIALVPGTKVLQPSPFKNEPSDIPTDKLFDVIVKIPDQFHSIAPGDELIVQVTLLNFGKTDSASDVPVEYVITDSSGKVISDTTETVAVATRVSLLKTFYTDSTMAAGQYTFTARAPSQGTIATSSDKFTISGQAVLFVSPQVKIDYTLVFQALFGLLLFFAFVVYFEYNKVTLLSKTIRNIEGADLKNFIKSKK